MGVFRPAPTGEKPLDALFNQLMVDNRVTFFLMPLPQAGSHGRSDTPGNGGERNPKKQKVEPASDWAIVPYQGGKGNSGKKGKGKGSGKSKGGAKRQLPGAAF